ncbi:unnamed protein product [Dicrocoelium dendriticum]|nr:unnamed protein product [Dicrocoelium dendriticum]
MLEKENKNVTSIEIRESIEAPWGFPDLQMEALNKLEYLVQLPFLSQVEFTAIQWPSLKGVEYPGAYLDVYYKINRTKSSGTCKEFLKTVSVV